MTTNNWDGTISKEMFDFSDLTQFSSEDKHKDEIFTKIAKQYLINCLIGKSHLTGKGTLLEFHDEIEEELITRGIISVIELGEQKLLAIPHIKTQNLAKQEIEIEFTLLDNDKEKFTNKEISKWVIFKNNREGNTPLIGLDYFFKKLVNLIRKMEMDVFMSEKKIIFILPQQPEDADMDIILKSWQKKVFPVISFEKSAKAGKNDKGEMKQGISPHQVKVEIYEPKTDQRAYLIRDFMFWWNKMLTFYGIRHDTLEDKEERAPIPEVASSQASFDALERKAYRIRWHAIKEYDRIFDNGQGDYSYQYGKVGNKK